MFDSSDILKNALSLHLNNNPNTNHNKSIGKIYLHVLHALCMILLNFKSFQLDIHTTMYQLRSVFKIQWRKKV